MKTKFSIVIRSKNESKWLPYSIGMISKQTLLNYEIILVDNCSVDGSAEIASQLGVKKIVTIQDFKPGLAINLALEESEGEYIVCLSAHCIPANAVWLENLHKAISQKDKIKAAYGRQIPMNFTSDIDARDLYNTFRLDPIVQTNDFFFHNANSIIESDYLRKNPFDNQLTNVEDRVWGRDLISKGYQIAYEPKALVFHHHGINHDNEKARLKRVTSIIKPLYLDEHKESSNTSSLDIDKLPLSVLRVLLVNDATPIESQTLNDCLSKSKIKNVRMETLLVSNFPVDDFRTLWRSRGKFPKIDELSLVSALRQILMSYEELSGRIFSHVIFLNPEYELNNEVYLEELWLQHISNCLDLSFFAYRESLNLWQHDDNQGFSLIRDNSFLRQNNEPYFISLYGLGTIFSRNVIQSNLFSPELIGIKELTENQKPVRNKRQ